MTDNFDEHENGDDFNEHEEIAASEKSPSKGMTGNLAEAWRTRPLFKFMVLIGAVFAVGVAGVSLFGSGNSSQVDASQLGHPPRLNEAPGGAVSPYMKKQTEMADAERSSQAIATGGSALPTPIGQTTDIGNFGALEKKDDPLTELRLETEKLKTQVQQQQAQVQQQQAQVQQVQQQAQVQIQQIQQQRQAPAPEQFDNSLAEAMQHQMQQLLEGWAPKGIKVAAVAKPEDLAAADKSAAAAAAAAAAPPANNVIPPKAVVNAGTVSYAQLLTEANSDVPGPILAQIVSGPLAGSRAVGSFQVANGYEKYLVLKFTLADKKGVDYQLNAIALDPDTTLGGMATEVDERYFARVVLPAAAGFLQGLGQGLSQGNSSVTTNGSTSISTYASNGYKEGIYNGLGQGAQVAGQFFQNQANLTKPLVRVAAGTPMGLFFVSPVYDPATQNGLNAAAAQAQTANGYPVGYNGTGPNPYGFNGPNPYGNATYPGTTVNGYGQTAAQNATAGEPYPNYATPGAGYVNNRLPSTSLGSSFSPYGQGYGQ